jgi:hypothetical protein
VGGVRRKEMTLEDTNSGNYLLSRLFFVEAPTNRIIVADGLHKCVDKGPRVAVYAWQPRLREMTLVTSSFNVLQNMLDLYGVMAYMTKALEAAESAGD